MNLTTLFLLAIGVSMDAFAVSVSNSMCYDGLRRRDMAFASAMFGLFQAGMPMLGYFAGVAFATVVSNVDHWIAFILLGLIGGKMLWEVLRSWNEAESCPAARELTKKMIFVQAIATSIDALAVGVSFAALQANVWVACLFIGVATFVICLFGHVLGRRAGGILGNWAQVFGGLVLIGIGTKILLEHLFG